MKEESIIAPKEISENAAILIQLADLFVHCLENERIRHDVIKEAPTRLSVAIILAKDSEKVCKKTRSEEV